MKINGIIENFQSSLVGIVPAFEAVDMPWRSPEAYDEWDGVSEELYKALVADVIRWGIDPANGRVVLPKYDFAYESYEAMSFIAVNPLASKYHAFQSFGTDKKPMDLVSVCQVDQYGKRASDDSAFIKIEDAMFGLLLRTDNGELVLVEEIPVFGVTEDIA